MGYGHCAAQREGFITLFAINMGQTPYYIDIGTTVRVEAYVLTPKDGNVTSATVLLNGSQLSLVENKSMPDVKPEIIQGSTLAVPPAAIAFWVLPDVWTKICT